MQNMADFQVMAGDASGEIGARLGVLRDTVYLSSVMAAVRRQSRADRLRSNRGR